MATTINNIGVLVGIMGDDARSAELHQEALAIRRTKLGEGHPATKETVRYLADLYEAWGKPDQATPYRALLADAR